MKKCLKTTTFFNNFFSRFLLFSKLNFNLKAAKKVLIKSYCYWTATEIVIFDFYS